MNIIYLERKVNALKEEIELLHAAIRKHRDQKGDDRCWMDDDELYSVLPEGKDGADTRLASPQEMLKCCEQYVSSRHNPGLEYTSPQRDVERIDWLDNMLWFNDGQWRSWQDTFSGDTFRDAIDRSRK